MILADIVKKLTSGDIPTGTLGGGGIIALVVAVFVAKRSFKFVLTIVALALLAAAVWWHLHNK